MTPNLAAHDFGDEIVESLRLGWVPRIRDLVPLMVPVWHEVRNGLLPVLQRVRTSFGGTIVVTRSCRAARAVVETVDNVLRSHFRKLLSLKLGLQGAGSTIPEGHEGHKSAFVASGASIRHGLSIAISAMSC